MLDGYSVLSDSGIETLGGLPPSAQVAQFRNFMNIFELIWPGVWLEAPELSDDARREVDSLLHTLGGTLAEAAVALAWFEQERSRPHDPPQVQSPEAQAEWGKRRAIEAALEAQLPPTLSLDERWAAQETIRFEAECAVLRARWASGAVPAEYLQKAVFVAAKAFLYSLDGIGKTLTVVAKLSGVPDAVKSHRDTFYTSLPTLTGVRDSAHHLEDRVRGLDRNRRPLTLKPVTNDMVHAPGGGALIINCLNGNQFGSTMGDGEYGEVEVSCATMRVAQNAIQGALNAFTWKGPRRYQPSH